MFIIGAHLVLPYFPEDIFSYRYKCSAAKLRQQALRETKVRLGSLIKT